MDFYNLGNLGALILASKPEKAGLVSRAYRLELLSVTQKWLAQYSCLENSIVDGEMPKFQAEKLKYLAERLNEMRLDLEKPVEEE